MKAMADRTMRDDYTGQFIVGTLTAAASAVFHFALTGQVDWRWVLVAFLAPYLALHFYERASLSAFREWRVRDNELISRSGQPAGTGAWELDTGEPRSWVVFGPRKPLTRGRYRATFRLKLNQLAGDAPIVDLDVASRHGAKLLALRTLTAQDFRRADRLQDFPLDFYLLHDDNEIEFRISTRGAPRRLVLDRVALARRVF